MYWLSAELPPLYMDMTVEEYLRFAAQLKKVPKSEREAQVDRVAGMTGVDQVLGRLIRNLSKATASVWAWPRRCWASPRC